jgi:carbon starvation protein CstA
MNLSYIKYVLGNLFNTLLKLLDFDGFVWKALIGIVMYFAGIHLYIVAVVVLALMDVFTGVWAAKKTGIEITSRKLRRGMLEKTGLYLILLVASFVLGKVMQDMIKIDNFYVAWLLTVLICIYELTSIIENVIKIYPTLAFLSKLKVLLNKVGDKQIDNAEGKLGVADKKV